MIRKKAVFNWSSGKDSALALYKILQDSDYEIISLLTTVNRESKRSTMHGTPITLLERQAQSIGLPLYVVDLTPKGSIEDYTEAMTQAVLHFKEQGVTHFVFGDIFLHDVRKYRQEQLQPYGIEVVEPLWDKCSEQVMEEFLDSGLQTIIVTTTDGIMGEEYIGKTITRELMDSFPPGIDPCGENGEYHTFCYGGGLFRTAVEFSLGSPIRQTYPIKLEDGTTKEYTYWFANLNEGEF